MSLYRFTGPYPTHYNTDTGSRYIEPGEEVEWTDREPQPSCWWGAAHDVSDPVTEKSTVDESVNPLPDPAEPKHNEEE